VERIVRRSSWRRSVRDEVRRELLAYFEDGLENVAAENRAEAVQRMMRDFGQPDILGKLIHRGKQRCPPIWEKAAWNLVKVMVALAVILFLMAWFAGQRAESAYRATVTRLREEGALRDVSQLQSTHPLGTIYYNGRDEDCATGILLSFVCDPALSEAASEPFRWLPDMDTEKEQALRGLISSHEEQLVQLRHVAELPPTPMEQVIRVTGLKNSLADMRLPSGVMDYARLMLCNAFLLHRAGHDDKALAECGRALSLAGHIRDIPSVICQLIACRIEIEMARILAPVSSSASLSSEAARSFGRDWDPRQNRAALAQAIELEAGSARWLIHDSKLPMSKVVYIERSHWSKRLLAQFYLTPFMRTITGPDETKYYTYYAELAKCARRPFFEIRELADDLEKCERQGSGQCERPGRGNPITGVLDLPVSEYAGRLSDNAFAETRISQARAAFALNQYKAKAGRYPESLDALIPGFLARSPADPYSGKSLSYSLRDGGYLLYSVGRNGQDETSPSVCSVKDREGVADGDDIVWGVFTPHES